MKKSWKNASLFLTGVLITMVFLVGITVQGNQALAAPEMTIWEKLDNVSDSYLKNLGKMFNDFTDTFQYNPPVCMDWTPILMVCDTSYTPDEDDVISRGYLAMMLVKDLGLDATHNNPDFPDLEPTHSCYNYLAAVNEQGIMELDPHGNIDSEVIVNRAEAAKFIYTAAELERFDGEIEFFNDVQNDEWYYSYITRLFIDTGFDYGLFETNRLERMYEPPRHVTYGWLSDILLAVDEL